MTEIFYPGQLLVKTKLLGHKGKNYLVVSSEMVYDLEQKKIMVLLNSYDIRRIITERTSVDPMPSSYDHGYPKLNAEWLAYANCYNSKGSENKIENDLDNKKNQSPKSKGHTANLCPVNIRVGQSKKSLLIFGDRNWEFDLVNKPTIAKSFEEMPLNYSRAFGGEKYSYNTFGKGFDGKELPNIEYPNSLIINAKDRPLPASYGPILESWEPRKSLVGSYDKKWIELVKPDFPDDMVWESFNLAPKDQQIKGFFIGNEELEFLNLSASEERVKNQLPGYKVRCFYVNQNEENLVEAPANLDTLVFVPDIDQVIMIWRSVLEVKNFEGKDISNIVLAYESMYDEKRELEYYQNDFEWRKKEVVDESLYRVMITGPLIPNNEKSAQRIFYEDGLQSGKESGLLDNVMKKISDAFDKGQEEFDQGLNVVQQKMDDKAKQTFKNTGSNAAMSVSSSLNKNLDKTRQEAEKGKRLQNNMIRAGGNTASDPGAKVSIMMDEPIELKALHDQIEAIIPNYIRQPLAVNADYLTVKNQREVQNIIDKNQEAKELEILLNSKEHLEQKKQEINNIQNANVMDNGIIDSQIEMIDGLIDNRITGKQIEMPLLRPGVPADIKKKLETVQSDLKERLANADKKGELDGLNAEGFGINSLIKKLKDSRGMIDSKQNSKVDQVISIIEERKKNNQDNSLEQNIFEYDEFLDTYRNGAHLLSQGLSPHYDSVDKVKDQLLDKIAKKKDLVKSDYACLNLSGLDLNGLDFSDCLMEQVNFTNCDLTNCNFSGSVLVRCNFENTKLVGANLGNANLGKSSFYGSDLRGAKIGEKTVLYETDFYKANLDGIAFVNNIVNFCVFEEASMKSCMFNMSMFMDCDFDKVDLTGANINTTSLTACYFTDTKLLSSTINRANISYCAFYGTDFTGSELKFTAFGLSANEEVAKPPKFNNSKFDYCSFMYAQMANVSFKGSFCSAMNFIGSDLEGADFDFTNANDAIFTSCNLKNAKFNYANVMGSNFNYANLKNVSFKYSNLVGSDFAKCTLGKTDFAMANLSKTILEHWRPSK